MKITLAVVATFWVTMWLTERGYTQESFRKDPDYCAVKYKQPESLALCRELEMHKQNFIKYKLLHLNDNAHGNLTGEIRGRSL